MRVAVVDIGTNSTRLLVADVAPDGSLIELERRTKVTRLGDRLDRTGVLDDAAMERVLTTLAEYRAVIDAGGAERAVAVLTSAVRDAANGDAFLARVRAQDEALHARVIPGDEEARLTFRGATSERAPGDMTPTVVIDVGGGSTELVVGSGDEVSFHVSTQAGVVRHTERHLATDPPTSAELEALAADVRSMFAQAVPPSARAGGSRSHRRGGHRDLARGDRPGSGVLFCGRSPRSRGVPGELPSASSSASPRCPRRSGARCADCIPTALPPSSPGWSWSSRRCGSSASIAPPFRTMTSCAALPWKRCITGLRASRRRPEREAAGTRGAPRRANTGACRDRDGASRGASSPSPLFVGQSGRMFDGRPSSDDGESLALAKGFSCRHGVGAPAAGLIGSGEAASNRRLPPLEPSNRPLHGTYPCPSCRGQLWKPPSGGFHRVRGRG